MSSFGIIFKIFRLLPDGWGKIKADSKDLEAKLSDGTTLLNKKHKTVRGSVTRFFKGLSFNGKAAKDTIHALRFYAKMRDVILDFSELCKFPEDMGSKTTAELTAWINQKIDPLRPLFKALLQNDASKGDKAATLVKKIVAIGMNDATNTEKLTAMKPEMLRLFRLFSGEDHTGYRTIEKTNKISDILTREPETPPETLTDYLDWAERTLPAVTNELKDVNIPGIDVSRVSNKSTAFLATVKEIIPKIEKKINNLKNADVLTPETIATNVRGIIESIKELKADPVASGLIQSLGEIFGFIQLKQGVSLEVVLTKVQKILKMPDVSNPKELIVIFKAKAEALLDFFSENIEIPGMDLIGKIESIKKVVAGVFDIDANVNLDLGISTVLEKVLGFVKEGISVPGIKVDFKELLQKAQLIAKFLEENKIRFSIERKTDTGVRSPNLRSTTESAGGAKNQPDKQVAAKAKDPKKVVDAPIKSGAIGASSSSSPESNNILWQLFGDHLDSNVVPKLRKNLQDLAGELKNNTLLQALKDTVDYETIASQLEKQKSGFLELLNQNPKPSLGTLVDRLIDAVAEFIDFLVGRLKKVLMSLTDLAFQLPELLIESVRGIRLSGSWLTSFIIDDEDLNIVCLIIAMPYSTLKQLLQELPVDKVDGFLNPPKTI